MEVKFEEIAQMTKVQLRAACKALKITGYGSHDNEWMRARLYARHRLTDDVHLSLVKRAAPSGGARNADADPTIDDMPAKKSAKKAASKKAAKPAPKGSPKKGSVKSWLVAQFAKGELTVAAAKAHCEATGRSPVTLYRQARELKMRVKAGVFVKE